MEQDHMAAGLVIKRIADFLKRFESGLGRNIR